MKTNYVLVSIASLALLAACGQQADDSAMEAPYTAVAADGGGMALPATTSSDAAREHYMAGWADLCSVAEDSANRQRLTRRVDPPSTTLI